MGAYKSRPARSCADEWKRQFSESCRQVLDCLEKDTDARLQCEEQDDLHYACSHHSTDLVKELAFPSNVNEMVENSMTGLHLSCCSSGGKETVAVLLQKGAKGSLLTNNGFSALHLTSYKGDSAMMKVLIAGKCKVDQHGMNKVTPLHVAAMCNRSELALLLLREDADPNETDAVGFSPLHYACFYGHQEMANLLLSHGADVDLTGEVGDSPLHIACYKGHKDVVEALMPTADVAIADNEKQSVLHLCCQYGHESILECLVQLQPTQIAQMQNLYGDTPMHLACYAGHLGAVKRLVELFGTESLHIENVFSETPLHASCTGGGSQGLVEYLLNLPDVGINRQGRDGHTALHSACYHGHFALVELLLDRGADPTLLAYSETNEDVEEACADWAYEKGFDDIVSLIKSKLQPQEEQSDENEHSYRNDYFLRLPMPSQLGRLRSITREKADILRLRITLNSSFQIAIREIELLNLIGIGSFGKVYKGRCRGHVVAVKKYQSASFSAKSDTDMFCREVSVLCNLSHPNVVNFIGACLEDPSQFVIVTEYISGGSLYAVLHEQKRALDLHLKLLIAVDVAKGMRYLHELPHPIMHRDLNSHNILLREDCTAVVADFGESRFLKSVDEDNLTKQPGNLRWMAPEIFNQSTHYSVRADIFSYALCVWELFSGELPFNHLKPAAAAADMAYRNKRPGFSPSFPRQVAQVVQHAWHHNPDKRPDFSKILDDLEPLLAVNGEDSDRSEEVFLFGSLPQSPRGSSTNSSAEGKKSGLLENRVLSGIAAASYGGPGIPTQNSALSEELTRRLSLVTDKNGYVSDPFATRRLSSSRKKSYSYGD